MRIKHNMIFCIGVALMILTIFAGNAVAIEPISYNVDLTPAIAENPVDTEHTVTATVMDGSGFPTAGANVRFNIMSGPNAGLLHTTTTDGLGEATFTYPGTTPGIDIIVVDILEVSGVPRYFMCPPATKIWFDDEIVDLEKYTLGTDGVWYDADTATGPMIPVGSPVKWKYVVTNTLPNFPLVPDLFEPDTYIVGEMVITWLDDEDLAVIYEDEACVSPAFIDGLPVLPFPITIPPGQTVEFFACGTAISGQYENNANVVAELYVPGPDLVGTYDDADPSHYYGGEGPGIPEFPTIVLPVAAILGLALLFQRRRD